MAHMSGTRCGQWRRLSTTGGLSSPVDGFVVDWHGEKKLVKAWDTSVCHPGMSQRCCFVRGMRYAAFEAAQCLLMDLTPKIELLCVLLISLQQAGSAIHMQHVNQMAGK